MDPGLNPLPDIYVLYTYETAATGTGCRAFAFTDRNAAQAAGEKLQAQKPPEVTNFGFMVLPLEGYGT
jgi:hypothetical protein